MGDGGSIAESPEKLREHLRPVDVVVHDEDVSRRRSHLEAPSLVEAPLART